MKEWIKILPFLFCVFFSSLFFIRGEVSALPSYHEVRKSYVASDSILADRQGQILQEQRIDPRRRRLEWTPLQDISPALREAVTEAEDKRFFDHGGVDYRSMAGALAKGLTLEGFRGASTITMQLAGLLDEGLRLKKGRRSLRQKTRQIFEALDLEREWSKPQILEAYLNLVTFRGELQGIAAASRGLFDKAPHGLDRSESLVLACLIRSPNASSREISARVSSLNQSLGQRVGRRVGDPELNEKVKQVFLGASTVRSRANLAPHVSRKLLKDQPPGSMVRCTLDSDLQGLALDRLAQHLLPLRSQNVRDGAVLVLENRTGEVLAYVSYSGEPHYGRFVDGVQAKRQAGSTLKPFLYGYAFDQRILTAASLLDDAPLDVWATTGIYRPRNYGSQFVGSVTARVALASSLNIPAVKTLLLVGIEPFLAKLRQLGMGTLREAGDFYGPSLALGSVDVSLWELVNAYRALANGGEWTEARLHFAPTQAQAKRRVFSKEAAFLISDILSDREARSTTFGFENPLATRVWTAVKTGTSKDMRDNWCIGYSHRFTVGVWVGNFTGEPMWNVSGITGAAPIWADLMASLHRESLRQRGKHGGIDAPAGLVRKSFRSAEKPEWIREEWFVRGTEPNAQEKKSGPLSPRIVYPSNGTVIAIDPDIPRDLQKVFFVTEGSETERVWVLNGSPLEGAGRTVFWAPQRGKYDLALAGRDGKILDLIHFEVRGSEKGGEEAVSD